jgi:hypothetical protein
MNNTRPSRIIHFLPAPEFLTPALQPMFAATLCEHSRPESLRKNLQFFFVREGFRPLNLRIRMPEQARKTAKTPVNIG